MLNLTWLTTVEQNEIMDGGTTPDPSTKQIIISYKTLVFSFVVILWWEFDYALSIAQIISLMLLRILLLFTSFLLAASFFFSFSFSVFCTLGFCFFATFTFGSFTFSSSFLSLYLGLDMILIFVHHKQFILSYLNKDICLESI